jgi:hypothetical protein
MSARSMRTEVPCNRLQRTEVLAPVAAQSGGLTDADQCRGQQLAADPSNPIRIGSTPATAWALRASNESVLKGVRALPLFGGFLGFALLIMALGATWFREGR